MDRPDPATLLLFVAVCAGLSALLDAFVWYLIWRKPPRWQYVGASGREYCARQIKQDLIAVAVMVCVALYAIDQGAQIP